MSETAGELIFRVVIDGKEANAALTLTDANVNKLRNTLIKTGKDTGDFNKAGGQMNNTIGQLGWVLGDANMFMVNFRMGMMSVANNIPMVVQGFASVRAEAKATGQSMKSLLAASIMGPGGVMLAVNALMFALQVLPALFRKSAENANTLADKMKTLTKEAERYSRETLMSRVLIEQIYLDTLNKKAADEIAASTYYVKSGYSSKKVTGNPKQETLDQIALTKQVIATYKDLADNLGIVEQKENRLAEMKERYRKAKTDADKDYYEKEVKKLEKELNPKTEKISPKIEDLRNELALLREENEFTRELMQLQQWYDQKKMIAQGHKQAMLELEITFEHQLSDIMVKYWGTAKPAESISSIQFVRPGSMNLRPVENGDKPAPFAETREELEMTVGATEMLKGGFRSATQELSDGLVRGIRLFRDTNNAALQFLDTLFQIGLKTAALFVIQTAFNSFGIPVNLFANGGVVTRPTLGIVGEAGPEAVIPLREYNRSIEMTINLRGEFRQAGDDLVSVVNKTERRSRVYAGKN